MLLRNGEVAIWMINRSLTMSRAKKCPEFAEFDKRRQEIMAKIESKYAEYGKGGFDYQRAMEWRMEVQKLHLERRQWDMRIWELGGETDDIVDVPNPGREELFKNPPPRTELDPAILYMNKAEARDKICGAIQYGSKYLSNGEPGTPQNVDKSTSLARQFFPLFKFVNYLHCLVSPNAPGTPLPLFLLGKSKNALWSAFLFLFLRRTGICENKERMELIGRISLFCWLGSSACTTLIEIGELGRLSGSIEKLEELKNTTNIYKDKKYRSKLQNSNERKLTLVKAGMDMVVAVGLLQLAPKKITPRVIGAFGFASSLISCYQMLPSQQKAETT